MEKVDQSILQEIIKQFVRPPKTFESLKTDRELILKVLKEHKEGWRLLKDAVTKITDDREVLITAIQRGSSGWKALAYASKELRADPEICLEAIRQNSAALQLVDADVRWNDQLISESLATFEKGLQVKLTKEQEQIQNWERINQASQQALKSGPSVPMKAPPARLQSQSTIHRLNSQNPLSEQHTFDRLVPLVALRVIRAGSLVLTVLGNIEKSKLTVDASLPGVKIEAREDPRGAVQRLIATRLSCWEKWITVDPVYESVIEEGASNSQKGAHTRYLKATFTARLDDKLVWTNGLEFLPASSGKQATHRALANMAKLSKRFSRSCTNPASPDIFIFSFSPMPKKILLLAWVPLFEFDWLRYSQTGKLSLESWISQLCFPSSFNLNLPRAITPEKALPKLSSRPNTSGASSEESGRLARYLPVASFNRTGGTASTSDSASPRPQSSRQQGTLFVVDNSHYEWLHRRAQLSSR